MRIINGKVELDVNELMNMVADKALNQVEETKAKREEADKKSEGYNEWAKTSALYGKEICGFVYNPYLVRKHLTRKFVEYMYNYDLNVDLAIRSNVDINDSIKYMIKECKKLAMLEKRDPIAFPIRKQFWSVEDCKNIFKNYLLDCLIDFSKKQICAIKKSDDCNVSVYVPNYGTASFNVKYTKRNGEIIPLITATTFVENKLTLTIDKVASASSYDELYRIMSSFRFYKLPTSKKKWEFVNGNYVPFVDWKNVEYKLHPLFVEGYKKSGVYFTLANYIMFNNASLKGLRGEEALNLLKSYLMDGTEAYILYAMLKEEAYILYAMLKEEAYFLYAMLKESLNR